MQASRTASRYVSSLPFGPMGKGFPYGVERSTFCTVTPCCGGVLPMQPITILPGGFVLVVAVCACSVCFWGMGGGVGGCGGFGGVVCRCLCDGTADRAAVAAAVFKLVILASSSTTADEMAWVWCARKEVADQLPV